MKRWSLLLLALWAAPGCVDLDIWLREKPAAEPAPSAVAPTRVRIQVNAGDVTDSNASEMLRAFREELDRAETEQRTPPAPPESKKK